jgi:quercetin dioxygenase-like cupin family protein
MMIHAVRSFFFTTAAVALLLVFALPTSTAAQELPPPQPIELDCVSNASAQILKSTPVHDDTESLVLVRVILDPGGSIGAHNHPGTLAVALESGTLGFTHLDDGDVVITRTATEDTDATEETAAHGEEITLQPGDSFIDSSRVHAVNNLDDGQTTVLIAGLIEAGEPLTACADPATPGSSRDVSIR